MSARLEQCPTLWISDLLTMPKHPLFSKAFFFKGLRIKELSVFGLIISLERMKSANTLYIDDGTGVILCAYDESYTKSHHRTEAVKLLEFYRDPNNMSQRPNKALLWMLERAIDIYDENYILRPGESVHLMGVISQCTEKLRVITISFIYPLRDLKSEILLMELRTRFYKEMADSAEEAKRRKQDYNYGISSKFCADSFTKNDDDDDDDDDVSNSNNNSNYLQSRSFQTTYSCVGEWHEEYFTVENERNCAEFNYFDQVSD